MEASPGILESYSSVKNVHGALEMPSEALVSHTGALVAHPGALVAHPEALEVLLEPWRLTLTTLKLTLQSVGTSIAIMSLHVYKVIQGQPPRLQVEPP